MHALFIIGTRPEAIKLSEPIKRFAKDSLATILLTGQHPALARDTLFQLNVEHGSIREPILATSNWQMTLRDEIDGIRTNICWPHETAPELPSVAVVQGDTDSAMLGAIHAKRLGMKVVHVEAGLRTYADEPFPEESNRRVIGQIADVNCCPSWQAAENLRQERAPGRILVTGQTGLDAIVRSETKMPWEMFDVSGAWEVIVALHRQETRPHMEHIAHQLSICAREMSKAAKFRVILHPNPAASDVFRERLPGFDNLTMHGPLTFEQMGYALRTAHLAITDSGGIQEERAFYGAPSLILRKITERPETHPWCKLADPANVGLRKFIGPYIMSPCPQPGCRAYGYGDGTASQAVADAIREAGER